MFFFKAALCLPLVSLALAAPAPKAMPADSAIDAAAEHPAMQTMKDISTLVTDILPKIKNFDGSVYAMNNLERDAQNALRALQVGIAKLKAEPEMGLGDAIAFGPVTSGLISGAYKMTDAFNDKKAAFTATPGIAIETYRILDDTYKGIEQLTATFVDKLPMGISWMIGTFVNRGLVNNIKTTRDSFKPEGYEDQDIAALPNYQLPPAAQPQPQPQQSYPSWQAPQQQYQPATGYQPAGQAQYQPQYQQQSRPQYAAQGQSAYQVQPQYQQQQQQASPYYSSQPVYGYQQQQQAGSQYRQQ